MRRLLAIALLLAFFTGACAEEDDFTFRKTRWGMSIEEVEKSEDDSPSSKTDEELFYKVPLMSDSCELIYRFDSNELVNACYILSITSISPYLYIDDFLKLRGALVDKYGEPSVNHPDEPTILSMEDKLSRSPLAEIGLLLSRWETDCTVLFLIVST